MNKKEELLQEVKRLAEFSHVNAIVLFGSRARGTENSDSDIDLAVFTEGATDEQEFELLKKEDGLDICAFSRPPLVIQFRIVKEGKILFVKNEKILHNIYMNTIRDYLDFIPQLRRFYWSIIQDV